MLASCAAEARGALSLLVALVPPPPLLAWVALPGEPALLPVALPGEPPLLEVLLLAPGPWNAATCSAELCGHGQGSGRGRQQRCQH